MINYTKETAQEKWGLISWSHSRQIFTKKPDTKFGELTQKNNCSFSGLLV